MSNGTQSGGGGGALFVNRRSQSPSITMRSRGSDGIVVGRGTEHEDARWLRRPAVAEAVIGRQPRGLLGVVRPTRWMRSSRRTPWAALLSSARSACLQFELLASVEDHQKRTIVVCSLSGAPHRSSRAVTPSVTESLAFTLGAQCSHVTHTASGQDERGSAAAIHPHRQSLSAAQLDSAIAAKGLPPTKRKHRAAMHT